MVQLTCLFMPWRSWITSMSQDKISRLYETSQIATMTTKERTNYYSTETVCCMHYWLLHQIRGPLVSCKTYSGTGYQCFRHVASINMPHTCQSSFKISE